MALPAGYSIKLVVNTAALVSAVPSKLLANGDDLRVVRVVEGTPVELDRVADTAFNSPATEIWFKTQAAIPADTRDLSYYIYYKNPTAGSPPANGASVFTLYDGFDDTMIDSTLWNQTGTAVESGGWARLSSGADLISKQTLTYGMLEMRIQALATGGYKWWGWEDGSGDAPNFIIFEDFGTPGFVALLRNDGGSYLPALTLPLPPSFVLTDLTLMELTGNQALRVSMLTVPRCRALPVASQIPT